MLFQKFLLLGLPVIALAASTTTKEDEEETEITTSARFSTSTTKTVPTTTSSSKSSSDDDDEVEVESEEDDDSATITTSSKGSKATSSSSKNSTSSWEYEAFGAFISALPECTRGCFEAPISPNVTEGCAKLDNWNCVCHFYKPAFYEKVFNDTPPATTTTKTTRVRTRVSTATGSSETAAPTETEVPVTDEELAADEFFTCLDDACGLKKWGAGRDSFFENIDALHKYCATEEGTYDEARNKQDYKDLADAKIALEKKKKAEEDAKNKKNDAGRLGLGSWGFAVTAVVGFTVAFAL